MQRIFLIDALHNGVAHANVQSLRWSFRVLLQGFCLTGLLGVACTAPCPPLTSSTNLCSTCRAFPRTSCVVLSFFGTTPCSDSLPTSNPFALRLIGRLFCRASCSRVGEGLPSSVSNLVGIPFPIRRRSPSRSSRLSCCLLPSLGVICSAPSTFRLYTLTTLQDSLYVTGCSLALGSWVFSIPDLSPGSYGYLSASQLGIATCLPDLCTTDLSSAGYRQLLWARHELRVYQSKMSFPRTKASLRSGLETRQGPG